MKIIANTEIPKKVFIIIIIVQILVGLFILYFATNCFIKVYILKTWNCTEATVVSSHIKHDDYNRDATLSRYVDYKYFVDEVEYNNTDELWWKLTDNKLQENDKIKIYYNIKNPKESKVYHISYLLIIFAIIFLVFPPLALKEKLKSYK